MEVIFLTSLAVRKMAGDFWQVLEAFRARAGDQLIEVPAGYCTDFASVPRLPIVYLAVGAIGEKAATLHDWLYSRGAFPRAWCDEVLLYGLEAEGVAWWRRRLMYRAVRIAGASHYRSAP